MGNFWELEEIGGKSREFLCVPIDSPKFLFLGSVYGIIHPDGTIIHLDGKVIHMDDLSIHMNDPFSEMDGKVILMGGRFIHKNKLRNDMDDPFSDQR